MLDQGSIEEEEDGPEEEEEEMRQFLKNSHTETSTDKAAYMCPCLDIVDESFSVISTWLNSKGQQILRHHMNL